MMQYALLMLGLSALVARAQEEGLSKFTVGDWNDISYGQPKLLSWTFGNGRPVSAQLDNDNGQYVFSFLSPYNNNTYFTWIPDYSLSPGPHTLVLTQGPVSDTSPSFMLNSVISNTTSSTNSSSVSVLTPTGPAGAGSSTASNVGGTTSGANSSITSSNPGGPMASAPTPTSTVQTTVQPTETGGTVNETVFSTSYQTNAAGSTTGFSSTPITTKANATTSASTLPGTSAATTSASIQTAVAAKTSLIGIQGRILGSGMGLLMTVVGGLAFAWLLL